MTQDSSFMPATIEDVEELVAEGHLPDTATALLEPEIEELNDIAEVDVTDPIASLGAGGEDGDEDEDLDNEE
jgi:hypothetical protein